MFGEQGLIGENREAEGRRKRRRLLAGAALGVAALAVLAGWGVSALRNKAYIASANRAQYVIEHYQQSPQTGDALAILTRSYIALDQKGLADQTRQVLAANYPDHPYLTDTKWPHPPSTLRKMIPFSGHH